MSVGRKVIMVGIVVDLGSKEIVIDLLVGAMGWYGEGLWWSQRAFVWLHNCSSLKVAEPQRTKPIPLRFTREEKTKTKVHVFLREKTGLSASSNDRVLSTLSSSTSNLAVTM